MIATALAFAFALLAAGTLAPDRRALLDVVTADPSGCSTAELTDAVTRASLSTLGTLHGKPVVLASIEAACICGNVNCPWYVFTREGAHTRVLLTTYAWDVRARGNASPLPELVERSHDSALVTIETVDAFRNGSYVASTVTRVRGDTGARKPNEIPVHFAPGASSAVLHGSTSSGWSDNYAFDATAGQTIVAGDVHASRPIVFDVFSGSGGHTMLLRPGVPATLPAGGHYLLMVESDSDTDLPYTFTLTIH
jgi:hypothetical protein